MLYRKLEEELILWKDSPIRKPLILRGARQVGKTSLVRQFGQNHFPHFLEVNLEVVSNFQAYDGAKNLDDLLFRLGRNTNIPIIPDSTLIFLDEIQESAALINMLRFFAEDKPKLHVIAAGSLLEARLSKNKTFPVGRVDFRFLYPLNFVEFLSAVGQQGLIESINKMTVNQEVGLHQTLNDWFQKYIQVGGMPEAVVSYANDQNYSNIAEILNRLHLAYKDDIRKYVRDKDLFKYYEGVIDTGTKVAGLLFNYENFGGLSYRSRDMAETITTIEKVMLLYQVKAINATVLPVFPKLNRPKKLIWLDVGIVSHQNRTFEAGLNNTYQGRLMEQVVGQQLIANHQSRLPELYYWSRDRDEGSAEVDFAFQFQNRVVAIEVKLGNSQQMKSLFSLIERDQTVIPIRISFDQPKVEHYAFNGKSYRILALPFYCLDRIETLIKEFCSAN